MTDSQKAAAALDWIQKGWLFLQRQSPLAAWAAWQQALRVSPSSAAGREALETLRNSPELPFVATCEHRFLPPGLPARRELWNQVLSEHSSSDLNEAEAAFRRLSQDDPNDLEARMNQGLCAAWLGKNAEAVSVWTRLQHLPGVGPGEPANELGVRAGLLAELARQGAGAEHLASALTSSLVLAWNQPAESLTQALSVLGPIAAVQILADPEVDHESWLTAEWLDRPMPAASPYLELDTVPRLHATLLIGRGTARFSLPTANPSEMARLERLLEQVLGPRFEPIDRQTRPLPIPLMDADVWRIRLPHDLDPETRARLLREWVEYYYEYVWIDCPNLSLANEAGQALSPRGAMLGSTLNHEVVLQGVVAMREQLALRRSMQHLYQGYPFDRLRSRLGLPARVEGLVEESDISTMSPAQLEALDPQTLSHTRLKDAYAAAPGAALRQRFARRLADLDPECVLTLDFPRLGFLALHDRPDAQAMLGALSPTSQAEPHNRDRIELLSQLLAHARANGDRAPFLASNRFLNEPGVIQRICEILESANDPENALQLERRAIDSCLEHQKSWPVPDPGVSLTQS